MANEPKLDWTTARVKDGELSVELGGELPKGWGKNFEAIAHLLDRGAWSELAVKKGLICVPGVNPGDEERLRHFLESAVTQANADLAIDDDASDEDQAPEEEADDDDDGAGEPSRDADMTERFRSFAGEGSDPSA